MFSQDLHTLCHQATTILLTGPASLDGDSIGACIALKCMLLEITDAHIDIFGVPTHQYQYLQDIESWKPNANPLNHYDVAIVVDGNRFRLHPVVEQAFDAATNTVLIDHHKSTDASVYDLSYLQPTAASTCSMIYEILKEWNLSLTPVIAEALYVGLIFDTGGFQHSNTSADVHRMAADLLETGFDANHTYIKVIREKRQKGWRLQSCMFANSRLLQNGLIHIAPIHKRTMQELECDSGDIEGLVNDLRCTAGVHFAILVIEKEDGVKVSLRSNPMLGSRTGIDCATFAQALSPQGGGHARAAGAFLPADQFEQALNLIEQRAIEAVRDLVS